MAHYQDKYRTATYQFQPIDQARNLANKRRVMEVLHALSEEDDLADVMRDGYHPDAPISVTHPINEVPDHPAALERFWRPMRHAIPDLERRDHIVAGGCYQDGDWVGCLGQYVGTFENDWLSLPASHSVVSVRFAEGHQLRDGKIAQSYFFIDWLDLMRQVGYWPLPPSLGREMTWLPPKTLDGVILTPQDDARSRRTIEAVLTMHAALGHYDGEQPTRATLDKMGMIQHWHPNFMWYGPAGIGTTRGLKGFEDYHQIPFLVAFPDRGGTDRGHFIRVGDGYYAVTGGWGYLRATHMGGDLLGMPPTQQRVAFRVMDFYRCDDDTIVENWVPLDIPHLLYQLGVDIFGRMRHQFRQHGRTEVMDWLTR